LTRLDTAFSRDQDFKIYVQNRMLENAAELWNWLEPGAHFYVCGDASRMAKDVDKALHEIAQIAGDRSEDAGRRIHSETQIRPTLPTRCLLICNRIGNWAKAAR
jgi:sulfite reductase alpha subunit-like flavoprotein